MLSTLAALAEQAWMTPALPGSAGSGAGNERPGGTGRPLPGLPVLRKGRAVSLTYLQRA